LLGPHIVIDAMFRLQKGALSQRRSRQDSTTEGEAAIAVRSVTQAGDVKLVSLLPANDRNATPTL
jgi:hypothetical protein